MRIVFDLDGTLANIEHRLHHIRDGNNNWQAFFDACDKDRVIQSTAYLLNALVSRHLESSHVVEIWSGRSVGPDNRVACKTMKWLIDNLPLAGGHCDRFCLSLDPRRHFFKMSHLVVVRMRDHGDYTSDDELKWRWLQDARREGQGPDLVFDDRQKVVDMWRRKGVTCFQVAEGNF